MSPRFKNDHERALELMIELKASWSSSVESAEFESQREWLNAHLADCANCAEQKDGLTQAVRDMRMSSYSIMASQNLVRSTQLRVRARAWELRQQKDNLRPLWISCVLAFAWALLSMPFLWQGFEWLGHYEKMPDVVWQTGFVVMTLMPIAAVGTIAIAQGMQGKFQKRASLS
jgi:hypothetical protein